MQALEKGVYEARWGGYRMIAVIRDGQRSGGELFFVEDDNTETSVLVCLNTDAEGLIGTFVEYLESHGHVAVINGQKMNLADFLVFEKVSPTVH